ncbi:MAG: efflux RND transporter periplasmic adaptor subunit, partial [bacterium]|nr:efflux RND transporter periplasmic adaptor subunit [bacterium]
AAELAEKDYKRSLELLKAGALDQGAFDKAEYRYDDASARLSWLTIKAPAFATVINRFHEPGEMVAPGARILRLSELDKVWAYIYIPQPLLSKVSIGMKVKGVVSDSDLKPVTGTVVKINSEAEFTPKNVQTRSERTRLVYGIKVEFDNKDRYLKPGMTVELVIPGQR